VRVNDYSHIGTRLASALQAVGLTQRNLAADFGTNQPTVSRYVQGHTLVPTELLLWLWEKHRISPFYILTGMGPVIVQEDDENQINAVSRENAALKEKIAELEKNQAAAVHAIGRWFGSFGVQVPKSPPSGPNTEK